jgi:hypothetical protein
VGALQEEWEVEREERQTAKSELLLELERVGAQLTEVRAASVDAAERMQREHVVTVMEHRGMHDEMLREKHALEERVRALEDIVVVEQGKCEVSTERLEQRAKELEVSMKRVGGLEALGVQRESELQTSVAEVLELKRGQEQVRASERVELDTCLVQLAEAREDSRVLREQVIQSTLVYSPLSFFTLPCSHLLSSHQLYSPLPGKGCDHDE